MNNEQAMRVFDDLMRVQVDWKILGIDEKIVMFVCIGIGVRGLKHLGGSLPDLVTRISELWNMSAEEMGGP